jgi:hypothetical protein
VIVCGNNTIVEEVVDEGLFPRRGFVTKKSSKE